MLDHLTNKYKLLFYNALQIQNRIIKEVDSFEKILSQLRVIPKRIEEKQLFKIPVVVALVKKVSVKPKQHLEIFLNKIRDAVDAVEAFRVGLKEKPLPKDDYDFFEKNYQQLLQEFDEVQEYIDKYWVVLEQHCREIRKQVHEVTMLNRELDTVMEKNAEKVCDILGKGDKVKTSITGKIQKMDIHLRKARVREEEMKKARAALREKLQTEINHFHKALERSVKRIAIMKRIKAEESAT